jgi:alpha/beta superfamily hydrolase
MDSRKIQERPIIFQSGPNLLEGLWHKDGDERPLVVGAPHPQWGGSMDSPVVAEVAYSAARCGCPTLRFNYRGVGASQGETELGAGEIDDYRAAIDEVLADAGKETVCAGGYSYGASVALQVARQDHRVESLILVAPPTEMFDFSALPEFRGAVLVVVAGQDKHTQMDVIEPLVAACPRGRLQVVEDADHVFSRGLVELGTLVGEFLSAAAG